MIPLIAYSVIAQKETKMPNQLKIKVCGMRDQQNVLDVAQTGIDFMGFIFYKKSKRYVGKHFDPEIPKSIQDPIKTVGVFVNEDSDSLLSIMQHYKFDFAQLHGDESVEYCKQLQTEGIKIIKAFGINQEFDFEQLQAYESHVDFFLFDTQSVNYGGTGQKFNWETLNQYNLSKPFLLSGGIGADDAGSVLEFEHPRLFGIDLNSKFERAPADKDVEMLGNFNQAVQRNC